MSFSQGCESYDLHTDRWTPLHSHAEAWASHDSRDQDRADAQLDINAEKEEAARQEDDVQSELDALFNDFHREFNKAKESHQQESDRFAAENSALVDQLRELHDQYSVLARLDLTKTPTISARPVEELEAIVTRAVGFTQSTSDVEAARILNSTNSDLSNGTQLIADVSANVFILIRASGEVHIFDTADILRIEYDTWFRVRLITKGWCLELCGALHAKKSGICEHWGKRYAEGVWAPYVRG